MSEKRLSTSVRYRPHMPVSGGGAMLDRLACYQRHPPSAGWQHAEQRRLTCNAWEDALSRSPRVDRCGGRHRHGAKLAGNGHPSRWRRPRPRSAGGACGVARERGKTDELLTLQIDLTSDTAPDEITQATRARFGRIDILVNNAGIGPGAIRPDSWQRPLKFWEVTPDQWRRFVAVHTTAPLALTNAVVPEMIRQGWAGSSMLRPALERC